MYVTYSTAYNIKRIKERMGNWGKEERMEGRMERREKEKSEPKLIGEWLNNLCELIL